MAEINTLELLKIPKNGVTNLHERELKNNYVDSVKTKNKSTRQISTSDYKVEGGGEEKEKNCSLKSKTKRCFLYRSYCHYEYLLNSLIIKREPASNQGDPLPPLPSSSPSPPSPTPLRCSTCATLMQTRVVHTGNISMRKDNGSKSCNRASEYYIVKRREKSYGERV